MTPDVERSTKRLAMFDLLCTRRRADRIGPLQPVYAAHAQIRTWHKGCVPSVGATTTEIEGITDQDWVRGSSVGRSLQYSAVSLASVQSSGKYMRHVILQTG